MFRTVLHYILTSLFLPSLIYAQTSLVLIEMKGVEEPELNKALSLFGDQRGKAFASYLQQNALVVATSAEARVLSERGLEFTVILEDTSRRILFKRALYGSAMKLSSFYHTYDQILGEADALIETHPDLITKFAIG
ncbi:MAG: hypothetical protein WBH56_08475, partial [Bacteroidota bacterium]